MNGEPHAGTPIGLDIRRLRRIAIFRLFLAIPGLGAAFFLAAGTLRYWQAWVYLAMTFILMSLMMVHLLRRNPGLLERRMRTREKEAVQRKIIKFVDVFFVIAFLLPGFDRRWGWSSVPPAVVMAADVISLLGYALFALVIRENPFAGRTVEVEQKQKAITTGPYAVVRHPMYSAMLLLYGSAPLALGSWWALIPMSMVFVVIPLRAIHEEKLLLKELEGYGEYIQKTKYRLIPGIW